jgi:hypothetical protein
MKYLSGFSLSSFRIKTGVSEKRMGIGKLDVF